MRGVVGQWLWFRCWQQHHCRERWLVVFVVGDHGIEERFVVAVVVVVVVVPLLFVSSGPICVGWWAPRQQYVVSSIRGMPGIVPSERERIIPIRKLLGSAIVSWRWCLVE